jgi:threonine dehydrogenase-like Zn-dependent dehydrogenase
VPIPAQRVVFPRPAEVEIESFDLPGSVMGTVEVDAFTELQLKELSIIGCFQPAAPLEPHHFLPWTQRRNRQLFMRMAASGAIKLEHLITHRVPYQRAPDTFAMIARGGADWLGIVFTWD